MVGIGFAILGAGYTLAVYGWSQLRSSNATLVQLAWPGAFVGANPDKGSPPKTSGTTTTGSSSTTATSSGVTITSNAQAQAILANPKSTTAEKDAAAVYAYTGAGGVTGGN